MLLLPYFILSSFPWPFPPRSQQGSRSSLPAVLGCAGRAAWGSPWGRGRRGRPRRPDCRWMLNIKSLHHQPGSNFHKWFITRDQEGDRGDGGVVDGGCGPRPSVLGAHTGVNKWGLGFRVRFSISYFLFYLETSWLQFMTNLATVSSFLFFASSQLDLKV